MFLAADKLGCFNFDSEGLVTRGWPFRYMSNRGDLKGAVDPIDHSPRTIVRSNRGFKAIAYTYLGDAIVKWATKVMNPASMYFLWKQGS